MLYWRERNATCDMFETCAVIKYDFLCLSIFRVCYLVILHDFVKLAVLIKLFPVKVSEQTARRLKDVDLDPNELITITITHGSLTDS